MVAEMLTSDVRRVEQPQVEPAHDPRGRPEPRSVQIAGGDPQMLAEAATASNPARPQIIDINMGCPAKKVCNKAAGSALMKDEALVAEILHSVVSAVDVPVTLKIRTGWDRQNKNGVTVARIAEDAGIQALAVHGRTRADLYTGEAEYDTIAAIKQAVSIPVFANGDIDSPRKARDVLAHTGAALLIGRAAQGRPWIFREIVHFLETGERPAGPATGGSGADSAGTPVQRCTPSMASTWAFVLPASMSAGYLASLPGARDFPRPVQSAGKHGRAMRQREAVFCRTA